MAPLKKIEESTAGKYKYIWSIEDMPVPYEQAVSFMEEKVASIFKEKEDTFVWLLEHPSLYTGGTSAKEKDLLYPKFPVHETGRGGEYTYHGPGQRVAYVMMDLKKRAQNRKMDLRKYIYDLESWIILTLKDLGVTGERREGRVGIWVVSGEKEEKIAAIGVRVRKWVTYHGIALNVDPDLSHYNGIVPCGIQEHGVTSLKALGISISMDDVDKVLRENFEKVFRS